MMQTSHVFSQAAWPDAGDVDDCWVVSAIQLVHAVAPWLRLVDVPTFRRLAGDPDDGTRDGGRNVELMRGIRGAYPAIGALCSRHDAAPVADVRRLIDADRPASLAIIAGELPAHLRRGFAGAHQVTVARKGARLFLADPLARPYAPWKLVTWAELRPAIVAHAGAGRANAIVGPTEAEALRTHPLAAVLAGELGDELRATIAADARAAALGEARAALAAIPGGPTP